MPIKGWKNAGSDLSKWRRDKANATKVKLVSLKKDGTESKMHDAVSHHDSVEEAVKQHKYWHSINPGRVIAHNMYDHEGNHLAKLHAGEIYEKESDTTQHSEDHAGYHKALSEHGYELHKVDGSKSTYKHPEGHTAQFDSHIGGWTHESADSKLSPSRYEEGSGHETLKDHLKQFHAVIARQKKHGLQFTEDTPKGHVSDKRAEELVAANPKVVKPKLQKSSGKSQRSWERKRHEERQPSERTDRQ